MLQNLANLLGLIILKFAIIYLVIIFKVTQTFYHFLDWPILTCFRLILSYYKRHSLKWAFHPTWEHNERGEENFQASQASADNFRSSERICYSSWNDMEIIHQDYGGSSPGFVALQWVKIELFRRVSVTLGRWFHGGCCCQSLLLLA